MLLKSRQGQHIHERAYHQRPEMRLGAHQQRPEMRLGAYQQRPEMRLGAYQQRPEMRFQADQQRPEMSLRADQQSPEMNPRLRADYFRSSITDKAIGFTTPCLSIEKNCMYYRHSIFTSIRISPSSISDKCLLETIKTPNATLK